MQKLFQLFCLILVLIVPHVVWAQQEAKQDLRPETVKDRKATLQTQLEALGPVDEKVGKDEKRITLEELIATLTTIEEAEQSRDHYTTQLAKLPERRQQLETERQTLEQRPPVIYSEVTDALREQYKEQLQTAQAEFDKLPQEIAASELRINKITEQLEQQNAKNNLLEKELGKAQEKLAAAVDNTLLQLQVERLEWQSLGLPLQVAALEAERSWLTAHLPLFDEQKRIAKLRLAALQRDLDTINATLEETIEEERAALETTAAELTKRQTQATDPTELLQLTLALETVAVRKTTIDFREQLIELGAETQAQQRLSARLTRYADRLKTLVEKAASGDVVGLRILTVFERLKDTRRRYSDQSRRVLQARLGLLNQQLFTLEDQLFDFDSQAEERLAEAQDTLSTLSPPQRPRVLEEVSAILDTQKTALRDQQQVLRTLVQEVNELLGLHQKYQRTLEQAYGYALANVFWIRNVSPLTGEVLQNMFVGMVITVSRLGSFVLDAQAQLQEALSKQRLLWLLGLAVLILMPLLLYGLQRWLGALIRSWLAAARERNELPRTGPGLLIVVQSTLWPAYISFLAWLLDRLPQSNLEHAQLADALVNGLQLAAFIVWIALLGRGLLLQNGWGRRYWQLNPKLCRFLQRSILLACLAGLVFMVPHEILLAAPGGPEVTASSQAFARLLFLGFQLAVLVLVGIVGWREGALMQVILAESRKEGSVLWRIWPILHLAFLLGMMTIMIAGMLGYRYATQFIFFGTYGTLLILLVTRLFLPLLVFRLIQQFINFLFERAARKLRGDATVKDTADRTLQIARLSVNIVLAVVAVFTILELWGVPTVWIVTAPLTWLIISRGVGVAAIIGIAILFFRLSRAMTASLIQPRTRRGQTREAGRKLKTVTPLVQAGINVVILLVATILILRLLGINLAPVLAGVGIFGLAVGFAAQSLIKDIINGLFLLFEDAVSVGDIVDVGGGISGTVEKVSLRSMTIRDFSANVHVVPNGTIDRITNKTKEFSRYVLNVGVAYREDVDNVINILQEIDAEMRTESDYGKDMLEPIEIMGLDRFEDSAVIVVARLTTRPNEQWRIGREFNRRMKKVFDERGIEIPFPHRTLYWGEPKEGAQPPINVMVQNQPPATAKLRLDESG